MTVKQTFVLDDKSIFNTNIDIIIDLIPIEMYIESGTVGNSISSICNIKVLVLGCVKWRGACS